MLRKSLIALVLFTSVFVAGCHHKVQNPIANIDSKQPDKVLFDRAMDAMKHGKYSVARTLLETLINTYPDSEYVARAKLTLGDAWYNEGGTAGLQQAEVEYKDFITFFPNMPEAAEAQLKVANIHYKQMEKPDRDYQQALRASDEYKALIQQFPDSKLVPEAKQKLRDVQEILAERQSRIAHFYYLRNNVAAAQARLTSLVDSYPLYSGVDEALYLMGNIYEKEADAIRGQKGLAEVKKAKLAADYDQKAIDSYSKIMTRYPAMYRADDARRRLEAMKAPIPKPTPEAMAQSQAEEDSRRESSKIHAMMGNFRKHPDMNKSAKTGEPNLEEEEIASAPAVLQQMQTQIKEALEGVKAGTGPAPGANQPPPGSPTEQPAAGANSQGNQQPPADGKPELARSNQQPGTGTPATSAPQQTNEIGSTSEGAATRTDQADKNNQQQDAKDKQDSSSKKKHKKGVRKLIPF